VSLAAPSRTSRPTRRWPGAPAVVAGCLAVATASLLVPSTLGYDPWAWLLWGREVGRWSLDTTGGPSWKPLPVALTTVLAPLGGLAVPVYAVLARTAALLAVVAVGRLAARLGGPVAAVVAGAVLVLTPDGDPRFVRLVLEGHEAPWSTGLAAAALVAVLDRRPRTALACTWLLALLRPEAWPFLVALVAVPAGWTPWRPAGVRPRMPTGQGLVALVSIPLLWFVPDWLAAGSPTHGADHARVLADQTVLARLGDSLGTAVGMVPVPVWALAGIALVAARRRRDPVPPALALAAAAWSAVVVAMAAALGYAALSRFFLPAAAVVCALAGSAVVPAVHRLRAARRLAVLAAASVTLVLVAPRLLGLGVVIEEVADRGRLEDELHAAIDEAGGADDVAACDAAVVTGRTLLRSAAAWTLELPLSRVELATPGRPAVLLLTDDRAVRRARASGALELAREGRWTVLADRCPEARP